MRVRQKLNEIFDMLDANGNDRISAEEINLDIIPADVLIVLKPLLVEMENFDEDLDREEFIDSSLALFQKLDLAQKHTIINCNKPDIHSKYDEFYDQNLVFHPQISKRSQLLAEQANLSFSRKLLPEERLHRH